MPIGRMPQLLGAVSAPDETRCAIADEWLVECRNCLAPFRLRLRRQMGQLTGTKAAAKALDSGLRRNDG